MRSGTIPTSVAKRAAEMGRMAVTLVLHVNPVGKDQG